MAKIVNISNTSKHSNTVSNNRREEINKKLIKNLHRDKE